MREEGQELKIVMTWEAIYDITDIAEYIELWFGVDRADQFQMQIQDSIQELSYSAGMMGMTYIQYRGYDIYEKIFNPSIIFYIVKDGMVHILRVLRHERDWENILKGQLEYTYPDDMIYKDEKNLNDLEADRWGSFVLAQI